MLVPAPMKIMNNPLFAAVPLILCSIAAAPSTATGQPAPKAQTFNLAQPGLQTISLGKLPYEARKAGRVTGRITLERGELTATLVVRMLSQDGADLAPQVRLLGFTDPTRVVELTGLKAGSPIEINADFVTETGTAAIGVELKVDVKQAPVSLRVEGLAVEERKGADLASEEGGRLVTLPEKGFAYASNLLPAMDSPEWRAVGEGAKPGKGPAGQTVLTLDEKSDGKWEGPETPLKGRAKELSLQGFMKFDAMATPYSPPFRIIFRDGQEKAIPYSIPGRGWPFFGWSHAYGQWIPVSLRVPVPDQAVSAQLVMQLGKGDTSPWAHKGETTKNNFIVFQAAGLKLWAEAMPSPAGLSPFNFTAWAGGAAGPGPFVPFSHDQQNSIALSTHVNDTSNLYFSKEGKWPAPRAWVENYLPVRRTVELMGELFDWAGGSMGKVSCSVKLEPFENRDVELPIDPIKRAGVYSINLDATQEGATVGQGVIRWACFKEPSDRADRRNVQYPFYFNPMISADGNAYEKRYLDQEARTLRAMGVRGFRLQCRLWGLEGNATDPKEAIAAFRAKSDRFHKLIGPYLQRYGFDAYISFFPKPSSPIQATEAEMAAWKRYVAAAVKAFPEITQFAFGNEEVGSLNTDLDAKPGIWGYTGSMREFTRQFLAARQAALEARPEIQFVVGQASDPVARVPQLFFEAGGTAKDVQGWAINSYGNAALTWKNLTAMLEKHGVNLSNALGIIPEIGFGAQRRGPGRFPGERGEAVSLVSSNVESLAVAPWLQNITWFTTMASYAAVHNFFFDTDWSPKPMVGAYLTTSASLGAGRPTRVEELPGVNAYLWLRPDGSKAGVIWAPGRQRLRLQVGAASGPVIIRDIMGNDTPVSPQDGVISVEATEAPIYLLNIQTLGDGSEIGADWTLERTEDGARRARVEIRNRSSKPLQIEGRFEGSPEVAWSQPAIAAFNLAPGESKVVTQSFTLADGEFTDTKTLALNLKANGVATASDFSSSLLTARPAATPPSSGADGKDWKDADTMVMRLVGEVTTREAVRWSGPDDLSARCSVLWDKENLYFRAEVKDDTDVHKTAPGTMFLNDNIQLAFTTQDAGSAEFSLGVSDGKPAVYRRVNGAVVTDDAKGPRLNVTRDEASKTTIYVAAIPWQALNVAEPKAGLHLRFGILVNDSDRPDPSGKDRQAIQWFAGIFEKAPSRYGDLTLSE